MVITSRYCLSFIVVLFVAALSGFDLPDILSIFSRKLRGYVPAYSIKKNTTNGFKVFHTHDSVTGSKPEDRRKFEAELPNDLWQSDVMHGPIVRRK
ncbi:MAG: hypothetical protein SRB2_04469 [Desulfobacteraceae bacterium Eth-SRB2]|nr:MAG: hypothetical protein SRB2_04469 [Desulfobacteraceae bacterium Eth-SRB2]